MKIRPTNSGQIAVEVASEAETKEAIDQLNTVADVTGYTAKGIPKKHPRLIIKNIPNDRLPADIIDTLNRNYEEINNLEAKDMKVVTILENNPSEFRQSETGYVCLPNRRLYTAIAMLLVLEICAFGGALPKPCELMWYL